MFSSNDKISNRQLKRMLIFDMFSASCLIVPYLAVRGKEEEGFIPVILGTILALVYAGIMYLFMKQFNKGEVVVDTRQVQGQGEYPVHQRESKTIGVSYISYSKKTVGSIITGIFSILYLIKFFVLLVFSVNLFTYVIGDTLLSDTNPKVILTTLLLVAAYGGVQGIEKRARFTELVYYLVLIPIIGYLLLGIPRIDISNLVLPAMNENNMSQSFFVKGDHNYLWGGYLILLTFSVLETLLFVIPYVSNNLSKNKKIFNYIMQGVLIIGILNLFIYIVTVGTLGVGETSEKFWSVITIMQVIELPGGFIKRQDGIMIAFWTLSIFTLLSAYMFYLAHITEEYIQLCILNHFPNRKRDKNAIHQTPIHSYTIIAFGVLAYIASLFITSIEDEFVNFGRYFAYIGIPQSILIPLFILLVSIVRFPKSKQDKRRATGHEDIKK
ncbi:spore germination protein [Mobilisporobacter senegalensis]|uniref:Spore germination protein n=1 Tax=Mobilisporobacter senegalensis TaxID=1329262 RepID=A0A3N1XC83_9FIRM|nr:GerAB/ArcD/ProY family transporter [Mobilisporobacter senegalensis]ROR23628.1 spore germination protein [Mobilisporobacter senegalensis]